MQILLVILAFCCEYVDSTLGMGYGTTLTPILLLMGYSPLEVVPVVLLSELASGIFAGVCHHRQGNVNFKPRSNEAFDVRGLLRPRNYFQALRRSLPMDLKVALLLALCSIIGTVAAVVLAVKIPKFWLKMYIGVLVLTMGLLVLVLYRRRLTFSIRKITILGLIASFNKGMSGGGYGPLVTAGQILCGVEGKNAVGITSLAEGLTCLVGVLMFLIMGKDSLSWKLAPYIVLGAIVSVPLSARSVKWIKPQLLKLAIAILTITLGSWTIIQTLIHK
ncbi:MAG: sulfite exporter TauE/SafE family protein [Sedimentisphaerales bacterium]|nr:sulfite exporter TauE/SafE family protein [Sedimentisphaerales bacterium]